MTRDLSGAFNGGIEEAQPVRRQAAARIGIDRDIANLSLKSILDSCVANGDLADGLGGRLAASLSCLVGDSFGNSRFAFRQLPPVVSTEEIGRHSKRQRGDQGVRVHCFAVTF